MERSTLKGYLDAGLSIEAIAAQLDLHSSTVSYWLKRYGLEANGARRHAPKGGLRLDQLAPLVAQGLPVREIAARTERSAWTVRYWIDKYGLPSPVDVRRGGKRPAVDSVRRDGVGLCAVHGETEFVVGRSGRVRCRRCRQEAVTRRRRRVKRMLVDEAGGSCAACGYSRCLAALHFHHRDPEEKSFALSGSGMARSLESVRAEADKCVLLCANCHAEVEAGTSELP